MFTKCRVVIFSLGLLVADSTSLSAAPNHQVSALARANLVITNTQRSFLNDGTDITRFDDNGFHLSQALIEIDSDWTSSLSSNLTIFYYPDGNHNIGVTEAYFTYRPLQKASKKWAIKAGFFYPELSSENTDIGWLSSDSYQFSAINAWYAEELRVAGAELSYSQSGRRVNSKWSWDVRAALYKGNDPLGSLLAWRGFAVHDRQTLANEKVNFAPFPEVINPATIWSPNDVPPFKEIDGRLGMYVGAHISYLRRANISYYFYDNKANPDKLTAERYYAWHTIFHNVSVNYQISTDLALKLQGLSGSTLMGNRVVYAKFSSAFAQLSHTINRTVKISGRLETFDVSENDVMPQDNNHSNGVAMTLNGQYKLSSAWSLGIEFNLTKNYAYNRSSLGLDNKAITRQWQIVGQWRY